MPTDSTPKKHKKRQLWTPKEIQEAAKSYHSGKTLQQTADEYGISDTRLAEIFHKNGIKVAPTSGWVGKRIDISNDQSMEIKRLYESGMSINQVAKEMNLGWGFVRLRVKRMGIARTGSEVLKERWKDDKYREYMSNVNVGRPSGTKGKTWKVPYERRKNRGGKNCHWWKGGITDYRRSIRNSRKYNDWRIKVYARDNYTCAICGKRPGKGNNFKLHADHIISFSWLLVLFKIDSLDNALECEQLWHIDNGRTLCVKCHRATKSYGRGSKK